jgi:hypothetical protein
MGWRSWLPSLTKQTACLPVARLMPMPSGMVIRNMVSGGAMVPPIVADTLAKIHAALPPNLVRSDRQPANPPEVVEIWFADT